MTEPCSSANNDRIFGAVVSLDIGGTKIAGALVRYDNGGEMPSLLCESSIPTDAVRGGQAVLQDVVDFVGRLVDQGASDAPILGIGVGTAGCVDPSTGSIAFANDLMPGWTNQPVAARLREEFNLPVAVMGDVHAHALGESRWGAARGAESCLMVGVGTGLGGAYVLNGSVVRGFHGAAGHIGHSLHPAAAGLPCACGHESHAETVTSGTGLAALYQEKPITAELDPNLLGYEIVMRAQAGEEKARNTVEFAGRSLGEAIGSWCNILDPELVILSGSVTGAGALWREAVKNGFASQILEPLANTPIIDAALGGAAPLIGAAENLLDAR